MIEINWKPSSRELKQFAGIWLPAIFAVVGFWVYRKAHSLPAAGAIWVVGAALSVAAFQIPTLARWIFVGWMCAAFPIGWTVSHLLLAAIYYLLVTPIGLILRVCGHDAMQRRFDRGARTYWIERPPAPEAKRYFRQF